MMCARFISSMLMHFNVEKDMRLGLDMMKYSVNHSENFTNVYPPFFIGMFRFFVVLFVELNIMLILIGTGDILQVMLKFVSLAAIN